MVKLSQDTQCQAIAIFQINNKLNSISRLMCQQIKI
jgi:hypothetical protein